MTKRVALAVLSVFAMAMFASLAQASVLRVVVVDTDDAAAYTAELMKVKPMLERLGSDAKLRIWQARFANMFERRDPDAPLAIDVSRIHDVETAA